MSPLAPSGTRGYPDWQRLQNWDTASLFSRAAFTGATDDSGVQDVRLYAYVGGYDQITTATNTVTVALTWYQDSAGATVIGSIAWAVDKSGSGVSQWRFPNLGPFVRVGWSVVGGGGSLTHACNIMGTNRFHPLQVIPTTTFLAKALNQNIAANTSADFALGAQYSGPASVRVATAAATWSAELFGLSNDGNLYSIEIATQATAQPLPVFNIPLGWSKLTVSNLTAGAANFSVTVAPSWTGAL